MEFRLPPPTFPLFYDSANQEVTLYYLFVVHFCRRRQRRDHFMLRPPFANWKVSSQHISSLARTPYRYKLEDDHHHCFLHAAAANQQHSCQLLTCLQCSFAFTNLPSSSSSKSHGWRLCSSLCCFAENWTTLDFYCANLLTTKSSLTALFFKNSPLDCISNAVCLRESFGTFDGKKRNLSNMSKRSESGRYLGKSCVLDYVSWHSDTLFWNHYVKAMAFHWLTFPFKIHTPEFK